MKELRFSVLGITQAGKTTAILHLAKNYTTLSCLCNDEDNGRTKISVRYYLGKNIVKDEFKLIHIDDKDEKKEEIKQIEEFASIINSDDMSCKYNYAEVHLIPNDRIKRILDEKKLERIVLYDTRGLMDIVTKIDDESNKITITDLTKVGIDKPDAVLFFYSKVGSTNIGKLYDKLIRETFSSAPFFVFIRADEQCDKKYNNLIRGILKFFNGIHIKVNLSVKFNDVEVKADFELDKSKSIEAGVSFDNKSNNNSSFKVPYYKDEKDIIYRLSEYDITTLEDEDKYINDINTSIDKIVSKVIVYNEMIRTKLLNYFDDSVIKENILRIAMGDIKKYEGGTIRKTDYCYPEKNQGIGYAELLKSYKETELLGPRRGISSRAEYGFIYLHTIVMCTLVHNSIYEVFNQLNENDDIKALLRTALFKTNDCFYCNSFLYDRIIIKKAIERFRKLKTDDDVDLFKCIVEDTLDNIKEQLKNV